MPKKKIYLLWKLKRPMIYSQQAGDPGELMAEFHSKSEGLTSRRACGVNSSLSQSLRQEKTNVLVLRQRE